MYKLSKLDARLTGEDRAVIGPLRQRLIDLGGIAPLVMGAFGGANAAWRALIDRLADTAAPAMMGPMLCPSVEHCAGVLRIQMRRRLCFTAARARSSLLQARLLRLRVGDGATEDPASACRRESDKDTARGFPNQHRAH